MLTPMKKKLTWERQMSLSVLLQSNGCLQGATARSLAITHSSLPYHSQHLTAWRIHVSWYAVHVCYMRVRVCVLGHWDFWVWDGLKQWCGGSRIARVERTATVKRLPLPILVKAIQSITLLSTPRLHDSVVIVPWRVWWMDSTFCLFQLHERSSPV